jgi:hypothetical protein
MATKKINTPVLQSETTEKPKKKMSCLIIIIVIIILLLIGIGGSLVSFMGPTFIIDILNLGKPRMSDEQIDKLINPVGPKNYQYPNPSLEAVARKIDCNLVYHVREFPRTNALCLNVFQTSPEEITNQLATGSYDRIILYAERSVFDAPTSSNVTKNYITDLYQNIKFMDQIAIPKFLSAYGLSDVSYNTVSKPYPYLYYRISSLDEADKMCHYGDTKEKIRGCATGFFASIIPITAVGPQLSNALPILRKADNARFSYLTHYPSDCFANDVFLHETAHLLNDAGQGITGKYVMDSWLNEQIAGYFEIYGAELACGDGTVILQNKPEIKDVPKALAEFNSVFPSVDLSHEYPYDNICRQAMITEWYRYLAKGDLRTNFTRFFVEQRATTPSFFPDTILLKFMLQLDNDSSTKQFLISKGCSL